MNYIDIELLSPKIKEIENEFKTGNYYLDNSEQAVGYVNALADFTNIINSIQQESPEVFDTVAFQKGVQEGRRLEREDVKSIIQSRIEEILGDAQPNPILRMELNELIKKIEE